MKEFSNLIRVKPLSFGNGEELTLVADRVELSPSTDESEAGVLMNCNATITCDRPGDASILDIFRIPRECIVTVRDSDRQEYQIGSSSIPARVILIPFLNKVNLQISCKQVASPFAN